MLPAPHGFIETAGTVTIRGDRLTVTFDRRSHNPILREAALDYEAIPLPWLGQRKLEFAYRSPRQSSED